jgi:hypothetical protein
MIEDAQRIFEYLPQKYKTQTESDYVAFLWEAFTINYEKEKYQFAYFAYHMLFMCLVYFQLAKIYLNSPDDIKKMLIFTGKAQTAVDNYENKLKKAKENNLPPPNFDPFSLAVEYERSIVGLFITIGCDRESIKRLRAIVDERNAIAHSNGNINFRNQESLDEKIQELLGCISHIHENSRSIITACTEKFLLASANPDENEYFDENDQVRELFARGNYLSSQDIVVACEFPIEQFKDNDNYQFIDKLHQSILELNVYDEYEYNWIKTRQAVEYAMESAKWDDETKTITLMDVPGSNKTELISNRTELNLCLSECADLVFETNRPEGNEIPFEAESVVDDILSNYDDRLSSFFSNLPVDLDEIEENQANEYAGLDEG